MVTIAKEETDCRKEGSYGTASWFGEDGAGEADRARKILVLLMCGDS